MTAPAFDFEEFVDQLELIRSAVGFDGGSLSLDPEPAFALRSRTDAKV
jgi:hypothetical protein